MQRIFQSFFLAVLYTVPAVSFAAEPVAATPSPDYFPVVKQELARLQTTARCNDITAVCILEIRLAPEMSPMELTVRYSRATDTVYMLIDKFIVIPPGEAPTPALLLKLLSLNGELVTSKFEWQASANAVRLSTVMSCDANFDRRAFRSQYTGLLQVAQKLRPELIPETETPKNNEKSQSAVPSDP